MLTSVLGFASRFSRFSIVVCIHLPSLRSSHLSSVQRVRTYIKRIFTIQISRYAYFPTHVFPDMRIPDMRIPDMRIPDMRIFSTRNRHSNRYIF